MFRNLSKGIVALVLLGSAFPPSAAATEPVSPEDNSNGVSPRVIIERVPDYLYARTQGLIPVKFRVEGLQSPVTFKGLTVFLRFTFAEVPPFPSPFSAPPRIPYYPQWFDAPQPPHSYTQEIKLDPLDISFEKGYLRLYPDNDNGFGEKANGTGTEYVAWLRNDILIDSSPFASSYKNGMIKGDHYYQISCVASGADGQTVLLTSAEDELETKPWKPENMKIPVNHFRVFGDRTVNVVNMNYTTVMGQAEEWSIDSASPTKQHFRAFTESQSDFRRMGASEDAPSLPLSGPELVGFDLESSVAERMFKYEENNCSGTVKLATKGSWWPSDDVTLISESLYGSVGTYFGVSYWVRVVKGTPGNRLGMDLDEKTKTENRHLRMFNKDTINLSIYNSELVAINPASLSFTILKVVGSVACLTPTGEAVVIAGALLSLAGNAGGIASSFYKVKAGNAGATVEGWYHYATESMPEGGDTPVEPRRNLEQGSGNVISLSRDVLSVEVGSTHVLYLNVNLMCKMGKTFWPAACWATALFYPTNTVKLD